MKNKAFWGIENIYNRPDGESDSAVTVYAKDVMYPHGRDRVRPETVSIHHCMASWVVD